MDASIAAAISEVLDAPNLFAVLGLPVESSLPEAVKRAYYKRALQVRLTASTSVRLHYIKLKKGISYRMRRCNHPKDGPNHSARPLSLACIDFLYVPYRFIQIKTLALKQRLRSKSSLMRLRLSAIE